ncbi:MAG TPA: aminopeptidase P family protein, partial [Sphingobacteriaceae bacterium]
LCKLPAQPNLMTYQEKLVAIREQMKKDGVSAYIIPSSDPHISEYLPDRFKCIAFASGFTGSAGTLVITHSEAGLWTDFRYFVQAEEQLQNSGYTLMKLQAQGMPEYIQYLAERLEKGATVAFDSKLVSVQLAEVIYGQLTSKGIWLLTDKDYLDPIWQNRPELPKSSAYLLDESVTGQSVNNKVSEVRAVLECAGADYHLVSSLDDLAWLFNIRGIDVKCNPVVLAFALFTPDKVSLFIDQDKLDSEQKAILSDSGIELHAYDQIEDALASIPVNSSILIDPKRNCYALSKVLAEGVRIIQLTNPTTNLKAVKNKVEVENTRKTMVKDGVALTKFFKWLEENLGKSGLTEISVAEKLYQFRAEQDGFIGESFDTIAGYGEHGALPHYKATSQSNAELKPSGLFLLDSGGQYWGGTTDITRVISLGNLTEEESIDYTLVLKGMIDGSTARFPKGSRGYQIDAITRKPLWDHAINYGHGTGHGVGFFLNVHEGPHVFNASNLPVEIELGMITSVEPGIYRPGKHGVRIENLVLTIPDVNTEFGQFYTFETLTFALIDTAPVKKELLEAHHVAWLNNYNQKVVEKLSPFLNDEEKQWLLNKAKAI